jgi:hypothetical protein
VTAASLLIILRHDRVNERIGNHRNVMLTLDESGFSKKGKHSATAAEKPPRNRNSRKAAGSPPGFSNVVELM